MQQQTNHDTSTQAMTEVALGLSMAFFSLLILALFSIGLPDNAQKNQPSLSTDEQLKLAGNNETSSSNSGSENKTHQYAFYFNGKFYDKQLNLLSINHLSLFEPQQPLILAVQDKLPLLQIMALRKQINHPNLSITMLNQTWQTQLENIQ
ncbi:hypothetical protein [uncultured Paraglaciecola sp.]|uniref:hypothetical protein n=1 Tax=uncultured Paraglaciecola sp. TaxID=1765024 RepID=UPI0030DA5F4B|tara:strand:- start:66746 stop:67195 length:450 start_codon:yes stop_codon:yes gene_type:complete